MQNQFNKKIYKVSAPANLKLLGEYAVLYNKPAIVCAINYRLTVELEPRLDTTVSIISDLGNHSTTINSISIIHPLEFVLASLKCFSRFTKTGCNLSIKSSFSPLLGIGSSAAVTVSCIAVIAQWLNIKIDNFKLLNLAHKIIFKIQHVGSGADLAASIFGGIICYQKNPLKIISLNNIPPLTLIYSGTKTKTSVAVSKVNKTFSAFRNIQSNIYNLIGKCTIEGIKAINNQDWSILGKIFNISYGLQEALSITTDELNNIIYKLKKFKNITGAKISGAGFGDCVIAVGNISQTEENHLSGKLVPISISTTGITYHD